MGIRLRIHKTAGDQRNEQDIRLEFDSGMTILQVRKIVEKIQYRLVDSQWYSFHITADETITDNADAKQLAKVEPL